MTVYFTLICACLQAIVPQQAQASSDKIWEVWYYQRMDNKTFEHLCYLARIRLGEDERSQFASRFNRLVGFVEQVLSHEPRSSGAPMTLVERLEPRPDKPEAFEWPAGTVHDYRSDQIIDFEGED